MKLLIIFILFFIFAQGGAMADIQSIELLDIQGLYGGRNVFINSSGEAWVLSVNPETGRGGLKEEGRMIKGEENLFKEIVNKINENDFYNLKIKDRMGIPDEARVTISITDNKCKEFRLSAWERNEMGPDEYIKSPKYKFDEIYSKLKRVETIAKETKKPDRKGNHDGFDSWKKFLETTSSRKPFWFF